MRIRITMILVCLAAITLTACGKKLPENVAMDCTENAKVILASNAGSVNAKIRITNSDKKAATVSDVVDEALTSVMGTMLSTKSEDTEFSNMTISEIPFNIDSTINFSFEKDKYIASILIGKENALSIALNEKTLYVDLATVGKALSENKLISGLLSDTKLPDKPIKTENEDINIDDYISNISVLLEKHGSDYVAFAKKYGKSEKNGFVCELEKEDVKELFKSDEKMLNEIDFPVVYRVDCSNGKQTHTIIANSGKTKIELEVEISGITGKMDFSNYKDAVDYSEL